MKITFFRIGCVFVLLTGFWPLFSQERTEDHHIPCLTEEQLLELQLPEVIITKVVEKEQPVHHLSVLGVIGKEIRFELLLPHQWNQRFAMGGGGGFVGSIQNSASFSLSRGFATAGTDTGHQGSGHRATWAENNMERQLNFGYMAVHRTAVVTKEIIRRYYCQSPEYNYFIGCSRGGGQAMMEAQRYPGDFDGIIAGAPAFTWPALGTEFIQNMKAIYPDRLNEPILSRSDLELLEKVVLDQCDTLDGIRDDILNDPRQCQIDFDLFPVCDTPEDQNCFSEPQISAIRSVYNGVTINGREVYPGFPYGGEGQPGGWYPWIVGLSSDTFDFSRTSLQYRYGTEVFKNFIFHDTMWDFRSYSFDEFYDETRFASSFLDATSIDYSDFKKDGSKMIIYHGWSDPALSALSTIRHYEESMAQDNTLPDYIRLFLLPGVLHCGNGPGPDKTDWLSHIQNWVENGIAPDRVLVSKNQDEELKTRPIFPYPYILKYDGKGDPDKPESFFKSLPE